MSGATAMADPQVNQVAWLTRHAADAITLTDRRGVIEYVNPAFERLTGFAADEAIGRTPSLLKSGRHSVEFYDRLWTTVHAGQEFRGVLLNRKKNGDTYHEEKSIRPLFDERGDITHFLASGRDVSQRMKEIAALTHAATHDQLTGLALRSLLDERLEQALAYGRRDGDPFAVALIDVDRFKRINDEFGHATGDEVLQEAARRIAQGVRETDLVARLGGDEFAVVLSHVADERALALGLEKIAQAFRVPVRTRSGSLHVTLSIGASLGAADPSTTPASLVAHADAAMYKVKRAGGNGLAVHRPAHGEQGPVLRDEPLAAQPGHPLAELLDLLPRVVPVLRRPLRAGEVLFSQGQHFRSLYLLVTGAAKLVDHAAGGGGRMLGLRSPGDWLGLEGIGRGRHGCDAIALAAGEAWSVPFDALRQAVRQTPLLGDALHEALSREIGRR